MPARRVALASDELAKLRQEILQETQERIGLFMQGVRLLAADAQVEKCLVCFEPTDKEDFYCTTCGFPITMSSLIRLIAQNVPASSL